MTVRAGDIDDLAIGTRFLENSRPKFSEIASDLQRYTVMRELLRKDRTTIKSGRGVQHTAFDKTVGAAEMSGLFSPDKVKIGDHNFLIKAEWTHAKKSWGWERREALMNRGRELVFKVLMDVLPL